MELPGKRVEIIDGVPYEVTLFSGDGKLYDRKWQPGEPERRGTRLFRPILDVESLETPAFTLTTETP